MNKIILLATLMMSSTLSFAKPIFPKPTPPGQPTKTQTIVGEKARTLMEALAAVDASFVKEEDDSTGAWDKFKVATDAILCRYEHVSLPDEWVSHGHCNLGETVTAVDLPNPVALILAMKGIAFGEGAAGTVYLSVQKVNCELDYKKLGATGNRDQAYSCVVTTKS